MELYWNDDLAKTQPQAQDLEAFLARLEDENLSRLELRRGRGCALAAGRMRGLGYLLMLAADGLCEVFLLAEHKRERALGIFREYLAGRTPVLVDGEDKECGCPVCAGRRAASA